MNGTSACWLKAKWAAFTGTAATAFVDADLKTAHPAIMARLLAARGYVGDASAIASYVERAQSWRELQARMMCYEETGEFSGWEEDFARLAKKELQKTFYGGFSNDRAYPWLLRLSCQVYAGALHLTDGMEGFFEKAGQTVK